MEQEKSNVGAIVLAIIIIAVVVGGGVYMWLSRPQIISYTFNNEEFSLELPGRANDFPQFDSKVTSPKPMPSLEQLLNQEEERVKNLCGQTDACGEIINKEDITSNGLNGIKFTIQYKGRNIDDRSGYINEYHSFVLSEKTIFHFWASASDLQNPEEVKRAFDKIIVKFTPSL